MKKLKIKIFSQRFCQPQQCLQNLYFFLEQSPYSLAYEDTSNLPNTSTANHTPDVYELAGPIEDYENSSALARYNLLRLILQILLYLNFSPLTCDVKFSKKKSLNPS